MSKGIVRMYDCPPPIPGECASSWLYRVSASLGLQSKRILEIWGYKGKPHEFDLVMPSELIHHISQITLCDTEQIRATLILDHRSPLYKFRDVSYLVIRRRAVYKYCPACLKSDLIPYLRKAWRFWYNRHCPQHKCLLLESCQSCGSQINLDRLRDGKNTSDLAIRHCRVCSGDLAMTTYTQLLPEELNKLAGETALLEKNRTSPQDILWAQRSGVA